MEFIRIWYSKSLNLSNSSDYILKYKIESGPYGWGEELSNRLNVYRPAPPPPPRPTPPPTPVTPPKPTEPPKPIVNPVTVNYYWAKPCRCGEGFYLEPITTYNTCLKCPEAYKSTDNFTKICYDGGLRVWSITSATCVICPTYKEYLKLGGGKNLNDII